MNRYVFSTATIVVLASFQGQTLHAKKQQEKTPDDAIRKTAAEFIVAVSVRDLEGTMKLVDTPFCWSNRERITLDKDVLRKTLDKIYKDRDNRNEPKVVPVFRVVKIGTLAEFTKEFPKLADTESLPQVLGKDGKLVLLMCKDGDRKDERELLIGVRVKNGKVFVIAVDG